MSLHAFPSHCACTLTVPQRDSLPPKRQDRSFHVLKFVSFYHVCIHSFNKHLLGKLCVPIHRGLNKTRPQTPHSRFQTNGEAEGRRQRWVLAGHTSAPAQWWENKGDPGLTPRIPGTAKRKKNAVSCQFPPFTIDLHINSHIYNNMSFCCKMQKFI